MSWILKDDEDLCRELKESGQSRRSICKKAQKQEGMSLLRETGMGSAAGRSEAYRDSGRRKG